MAPYIGIREFIYGHLVAHNVCGFTRLRVAGFRDLCSSWTLSRKGVEPQTGKLVIRLLPVPRLTFTIPPWGPARFENKQKIRLAFMFEIGSMILESFQ